MEGSAPIPYPRETFLLVRNLILSMLAFLTVTSLNNLPDRRLPPEYMGVVANATTPIYSGEKLAW